MLISKTARQHGRGTDKYKSVVYMTDDERAAARNGQLVMFRSDYLSGGNHGTRWRRVLVYNAYGRTRYVPRVPSHDEITRAEDTTLARK